MTKNMQPQDEAQMKELFEEGSLHGAMALSAMAKLPVKKGTAYRGERATTERLAKMTKIGEVQSNTFLTSVSLSADKAAQYANGSSKTAPNETVSVRWEIRVSDGRDIQSFSIYGKGEGEWLLFPGAKIVADRVVEEQTGPAGTPPATRWVRIWAHQTS
jgi:hypothetical protein